MRTLCASTLVRWLALLCASTAGLGSRAVSAQTMPDDVRRKLVEMGPLYSGPAVLDLYRPLAAAASKDGISVTKNVAYGQHPRQILDVYRPAGRTNVPVLVYIHGGSYVGGNKDDDFVYGNVTTYFARNGILAINADYRLAPEF